VTLVVATVSVLWPTGRERAGDEKKQLKAHVCRHKGQVKQFRQDTTPGADAMASLYRRSKPINAERTRVMETHDEGTYLTDGLGRRQD